MPRKLKVHYLAVDPATPIEDRPQAGLMQGKHLVLDEDEVVLDGPVSSRVAILDLDPQSGQLLPGATFLDAGPKRALATHDVANKSDLAARDFQQVSVFGAIRTTMDIFEKPDVLGRRLTWGFDGPQLLVVPRAGRMANAFYHRESRSLQFFYFDGLVGDEETTVYTCLSPDIVAHETAHAILDGIAPDLYDATAPQSLGLHEALADITAFLFAAQSRRLRELVLERNGGDLRQPGAFNAIAEQFGRARSGRIQPLRDLMNDKTLKTVASTTPHALSEVLTGTLYEMFLESYETELAEQLDGIDDPGKRFSASGGVLHRVAARFGRIVLRALDYLPPGEVSFADYIRAIIAADTASNPESPQERDFLVKSAIRRGLIAHRDDALPALTDLDLDGVDLAKLLGDDAVAQSFAEANRKAFFVPDDADPQIRPRLAVSRLTYRKGGAPQTTKELIVKVTWTRSKPVAGLGGVFDFVDIRYGTTIAIGWTDRAIRAVVTNSPLDRDTDDMSTHDAMRAGWLAASLTDGTISLQRDAKILPSGAVRFHGLAQQLHMDGR